MIIKVTDSVNKTKSSKHMGISVPSGISAKNHLTPYITEFTEIDKTKN